MPATWYVCLQGYDLGRLPSKAFSIAIVIGVAEQATGMSIRSHRKI
jgi:hypothetical protein